MAQQTAVESLLEKMSKLGVIYAEGYVLKELNDFIKQVIAMEKEQIKNSFNDGYCKGDEELSWDDIEQYYNETYNK